MQRDFGQDRELQDAVIRYLTDAEVRSRSEDSEFLKRGEAERAQRFSRFLARRYYRDRLQRGFKLSTSLVSASNAAAGVVDSPEFDSILSTCVLGSVATAKQAGNLARESSLAARSDDWWSELLDYDYAFFIQLAASERTPHGSVPQKSASAIIRNFRFSIPESVARLEAGENFTIARTSPTTLLFSRTDHGRVYVVELDANASRVFTAVDGVISLDEIAIRCALSQDEVRGIMTTLQTIGAVVMPD